MYTAEMRLRVLRKAPSEAVSEAVDALVIALQRSGQILGEEWPVAATRTMVRIFVSIPERTSLQRKHDNKWVAERKAALAKVGLSKPTCTVLGFEPETLSPCSCDAPSAFVLFTHFISMESPLRCADCFCPVPLYRITPTSDVGAYEDVDFWRHTYQRCDDLQMGCTVGERYCTRQMSQLDSDLSKLGLDCCRRIAKATGKPCYYYLYRWHGRSRKRGIPAALPLLRRHLVSGRAVA